MISPVVGTLTNPGDVVPSGPLIGDGLPRLATEDVQVGDVLVGKGELVLVLVEGANYDPDAFPDPDQVDLERPNASTHLSFGGGAAKNGCASV